jgi:hypothetical protein
MIKIKILNYFEQKIIKIMGNLQKKKKLKIERRTTNNKLNKYL